MSEKKIQKKLKKGELLQYKKKQRLADGADERGDDKDWASHSPIKKVGRKGAWGRG